MKTVAVGTFSYMEERVTETWKSGWWTGIGRDLLLSLAGRAACSKFWRENALWRRAGGRLAEKNGYHLAQKHSQTHLDTQDTTQPVKDYGLGGNLTAISARKEKGAVNGLCSNVL